MNRVTGYPSQMPLVQQAILRTLKESSGDLTMSDLVKEVQTRRSLENSMSIRAAILPLITLRRIELTPERKLRLTSTTTTKR